MGMLSRFAQVRLCLTAMRRGHRSPNQSPRRIEEETMRRRGIVASTLLMSLAALGLSVATARADGNVHNVNHVIIIMQENHSFDNYFGALPYAPGSPYHGGSCKNSHHR